MTKSGRSSGDPPKARWYIKTSNLSSGAALVACLSTVAGYLSLVSSTNRQSPNCLASVIQFWFECRYNRSTQPLPKDVKCCGPFSPNIPLAGISNVCISPSGPSGEAVWNHLSPTVEYVWAVTPSRVGLFESPQQVFGLIQTRDKKERMPSCYLVVTVLINVVRNYCFLCCGRRYERNRLMPLS